MIYSVLLTFEARADFTFLAGVGCSALSLRTLHLSYMCTRLRCGVRWLLSRCSLLSSEKYISYITLTQSRELHVTGYFVARCVRAMDLFFCVYTLLDYELIPEFLLVPTSASTILEARAVLIFRKFTLCCTYHHTELIYTELVYTELTLQPTAYSDTVQGDETVLR